MGILDRFKKKKDDLGADPFGGEPAGLQGDPFQNSNSYPDMNQPMQVPDQQGFQPYNFPPPAEPQQQGFSPEAAGFERIPPGQQSYGDQRQQNINDISQGKEFELINAKLDAIKAELDSVNQRLKRIERIAEEPAARKDSWNY